MKIYLVGGAVRDKMLGLPVKERDFVVVGATVDDMLRLGFRKVGKEFPVFLHPKTHEEYALARMERKTGPGYTGFDFDTSPQVTLEEDLIRRDLTINAMAESENGVLFDPYHGAADLKAKLLRHVSPAFAEDPVRILRLGRFFARFYHLGFQVADETVQLMQSMVRAGEIDALVAERVWKELERALGEPHPEQFFHVLALAEALPILFPALQTDGIGMQALVTAAAQQANSLVRFAALTHELKPEAISALCQRYKLPNDYHTLAKLTATHYRAALAAPTSDAESLLQLFMVLDIFRRKERFTDFLHAVKAIAVAKKTSFQSEWLAGCAERTRDTSATKVKHFIAEGYAGMELAAKLRACRLQIIADYLKT